MATFRCGQTNELQRPVDYPELARFLEEHGPGLTHGDLAVRDLPARVEELERKGVFLREPGVFTAGTGWRIANFNTVRSGLRMFANPYHYDHLADASSADAASCHAFTQARCRGTAPPPSSTSNVVESGFAAFADGTCGNAGQDLRVPRRRAAADLRLDLDGDGRPDVVLCDGNHCERPPA